MMRNKQGGGRSTPLHNATTTATSRAYQPHRPGYHWERAKQPQDEDEDDFLQRIVHGSCQGVPGCQGENLTCHMVEQLDLLTHCRHPASFLSFFHDHHRDRPDTVEILHAGAYRMPEGCEYCGAPDTQHCRNNTNCQRPQFYFQKKRPPFAKPDPTHWDPVTEHAVEQPVRPASPFQGTWVAGLFLGGRTESKTNGSGR